MPDVLDEGEPARGGPAPRLARGQQRRGAGQEGRRGFEGQQEGLEVAPFHGHASYGYAHPGSLPNTRVGPKKFRFTLQTMGIHEIRQYFLSKLSSPEEARRPDETAIAACALLLELAHADDDLADAERERILRAVREDFGVAPGDVEEIVRLAEAERRESVDLYQFTRLITERFSREERLRLVEVIWGVVYSDGTLTAAENQLARRIAELLGFQHPEVQAVREKVAGKK